MILPPRFLLCGVAVMLAASAELNAQGWWDFDYTSDGSAITITGYLGTGGDVIIPDHIDGLPVTTIGTRAFWSCTNITSCTLGANVTQIVAGAFSFCGELASVTIPEGVTSIGGIRGSGVGPRQRTGSEGDPGSDHGNGLEVR